ncbi:G-protein coupled receptor 135 [Cyprinodon tularosa]|uniref:G protein-coupled receptor 135 n=1 Tax=Cyprinodon variegatus TaxID=28743 RepID=A0A3Q2DCK8_CYPVA|nr:PREDICTED: probable G-protein coupled receptor 135 [Cyprinodon variegatus]XP_015250172.1 PREDICTED: probable G-protein coupled receptor 135 [Cyprinodon variegatus]XP_038134667.1 G-protein coupled receptor 135 [Cyprinodon tularosa]
MDSPVSMALQSGSNYTADSMGPSITASPVEPRVVSIVTGLVTATTQASVGASRNLSALREQRGTDEGEIQLPPTTAVLSAADGNSALQGMAVAAQALVLLFIFLLSSLGNSAVVVVIIKHRQLRTVTNAFIMSLSLSDFLTAVLCLPFSFVMLFSKDGVWMFGDAFCVANGFFNTCFGIISTLTMTLISFDRYYAIVRQPQAKIGRQKATQLLVAVWLTAVVFSLPGYLLVRTSSGVHKRGFYHCMYVFHPGSSSVGTAYSICLISVCYLLPFSLMCFCHYNICKTVRLSEIRVRPVTTYSYLLRFYSEMRTATTVLIMIVFIICCWGPYCLMGLVTAIGNYRFNPAMDTVAIWLAWANGAINPLIYVLRNPNISMLLGRSREEGYRTRNIAAYLSGQSRNRETRLNQVERIRDRYVTRAGTNNSRLSSSSPGKTGVAGGAEMWACKNPAVFFCRDTRHDTTSLPNAGGEMKPKTADTSL